jgi:hypothetical protein
MSQTAINLVCTFDSSSATPFSEPSASRSWTELLRSALLGCNFPVNREKKSENRYVLGETDY